MPLRSQTSQGHAALCVCVQDGGGEAHTNRTKKEMNTETNTKAHLTMMAACQKDTSQLTELPMAKPGTM